MRPAFDPALAERIAPTGTLRASINLGNPILARTDATTGEPAGVSVDLARELARRLGVPLALQAFGAAAKSVDAVGAGAADVGFFAIDPQRGGAIAFTPPYVLIEGAYLVRAGSALQANEAVDRARAGIAPTLESEARSQLHNVTLVNGIKDAAHSLMDGLGSSGYKSDDPIRRLSGEAHRVRDENHRDAFVFPDALQLVLQTAARERVECAERFVEQQYARAVDETARDRHTLRHAAR